MVLRPARLKSLNQLRDINYNIQRYKFIDYFLYLADFINAACNASLQCIEFINDNASC